MDSLNLWSTASQSAAIATESRLPKAAARERILIVDDSATARQSYCRLLSSRYECFEAQNVNEAIQKLKLRDFELVITDVIMPGLSGVELLRHVLDRYQQTAVIVVSGVDRPQRALDAVRLGAFDYLIKPCDEEVLDHTVARALERRKLLSDAVRYKADLEQRNEELARGKAELERLQAQIVHNEKMASLGKLSAGIAHEINNPVAFVSGNLELLTGLVNDLTSVVEFYEAGELPPDAAAGVAEFKNRIKYDRLRDDLKGTLGDCREGVERVREIVQNLRTFSRLDEAELKNTDVHEGLDSTIRMLSRYFSGGQVKLVRNYGNLPSIEAYAAQLNQVWMNLLVNAAQAIGSGSGEVTVSTAVENGSVRVSVADTGSGISDADLSKIFDPFFTTKPVGEGSGLGLSISFGIVQRHNGTIEVKSVPGNGTTFHVVLPLKTSHKDEKGFQINPTTKR